MGYEWKLPDRFIAKLEENPSWHANVVKVIENVQDYFYETPYYFPEYTNHGILHIQKVLELCDRLITDESLKEMTAREVAVLVMAVLALSLIHI